MSCSTSAPNDESKPVKPPTAPPAGSDQPHSVDVEAQEDAAKERAEGEGYN